MEKTVFITGATSGIGKATALRLADKKHKLIITGRRAHLLSELEKQLRQKTRVLTLNFDVRDYKQVEKSIQSIPAEWKRIDVLINNAGLAAGLNPIDKGDLNDWEVMIDTNIKGLLYVTKKSATTDGAKFRKTYNQHWFHCWQRSISKRQCILCYKICCGCFKQSHAHRFARKRF